MLNKWKGHIRDPTKINIPFDGNRIHLELYSLPPPSGSEEATEMVIFRHQLVARVNSKILLARFTRLLLKLKHGPS